MSVALVAAAAVGLPVGVNAATGDVVNIADGYTAGSYAKVTGGRLHVTDGLGGLTVDGVVQTKDADVTTLAFASTGNTVTCDGLSGTSKILESVSTAAFEEIRVHVNRSGTCDVIVRVAVMEGGNNIGALDTIFVTSDAPVVSRTHRVPGRTLRVSFSALRASGTGNGAVSVRLFGLT